MGYENKGARYVLTDPVSMPNASAFLWNRKMMIQATCRGYATAQFMQPEPSKYVAGPMLEAKSFMQPEQPYYAHHPGRFFYIKDSESKSLFSVPYEPVRAQNESFKFIIDKDQISWEIENQGLRIRQILTLSAEHTCEFWDLQIINLSQEHRKISVYPYFPVGYRSWMNQSGHFDAQLNAVVCHNITPYQKVEQYFENASLSELTYLMSDREPDAWETRQQVFEGEGGLHNPDGVSSDMLQNGVANYQIPAAIMQFNLELDSAGTESFRFLFGPAKDKKQIESLRHLLFTENSAEWLNQQKQYSDYVGQGGGCVKVNSPDKDFDHFVNHWLPRQVFYHGDVNRLSTDPQTRNYLQDNMGLSYLLPGKAKKAFLTAISQQKVSGQMPDGILLDASAELKYINQVPHTDHCVWLPICLESYLNETGDYGILEEYECYNDSESEDSCFTHINKAMHWLLKARDERGLSLINQGDWCDPMNMVGYKGRGVSAWLTIASAYAFKVWARICTASDHHQEADFWNERNRSLNELANQYFWAENWYARGITDDGRVFGTDADIEGKIFLNPQSWAMLSGACTKEKVSSLVKVVTEHLDTPYGMMMLAPSYTSMVEDVGRVTQKFPGTAENGSIYNHATAFFIFSLFEQQKPEQAFALLRKMLPSDADARRRGQLPVFIPNYYRGAYHQYPEDAGQSSQLFNTGTVAWFYRCVIDQMLGLKGCQSGLLISPCLPADWEKITVQRIFRGASFNLTMYRSAGLSKTEVRVDGALLSENCISDFQPDKTYQVEVALPVSDQTIREL